MAAGAADLTVTREVMGLDGVELVMAVEEHFGIGISDAEASMLETPRLMANLVVRKVSGEVGEDQCATQRAFYRIRRELRGMGLSRSAVRPEARFNDLCGEETWRRRKAWWRRLGDRLNVGWEKGWRPVSIPFVPASRRIPPNLATVGGASKWLAARRFGEFGVRFSCEEVEAALPGIIVEQLGISPKHFDWDAEFVRDYGVD